MVSSAQVFVALNALAVLLKESVDIASLCEKVEEPHSGFCLSGSQSGCEVRYIRKFVW